MKLRSLTQILFYGVLVLYIPDADEYIEALKKSFSVDGMPILSMKLSDTELESFEVFKFNHFPVQCFEGDLEPQEYVLVPLPTDDIEFNIVKVEDERSESFCEDKNEKDAN